jgi:uncharacterized membrane protein YdjX (TVP38/TMEM64 family)
LTRRKLLAAVFIACIVAAYVHGPTDEEILVQQTQWKLAIEERPFYWAGIFLAIEIGLLGMSVPVASGMTILCGYLFGRWPSVLIIGLGSPIGALLAMLANRYFFRGMVRRMAARGPRMQRWVEAADQGFEREGWYYLLLLRLTPVIPFFVINIVMGLTRIAPWTFFWVTFVGMLPVTLVLVNAGASARDIRSAQDLISLETILALMLLVFFPIALRAILPRFRAVEDLRP